jgi:cellulose synthase operon protein C
MDMKRGVAQRVVELERLVESGRSFTQAVNELVPPPKFQTTLLRRASVSRVFDRAIFDEVIAAGFSVGFDEFVQTFGVERTQPLSQEYRVVDAVAAEALEGWLRDDRNELIRFTGDVHSHLLRRSDKSPLEVLRFRIPLDPSGGLNEFDRLFDEADHAFDLATCNALVQMLRELDNFTAGTLSVSLKLLSPELRGRCDELIPYVAARGRFIEDYAKSTNYLQRTELFAQAEGFLKGDRSGIFPVYGAGGRGKTMFLRWLVARYCVPWSQRIPVAKIDFDDINIAKLKEFPQLILVRLAEQLNRQIMGAPFGEYLERNLPYVPIILPTPRIPEGIQVDGLEQELRDKRSLAEAATQDFGYGVAGRQVVLILDTLEEAVLHFPDSLHAVVQMIKKIVQPTSKFGPIKLILSGRYNLKERGFLSADDAEPVEVGLFSDLEAHDYLNNVRALNFDLIPVVVAKAQGNPFILTLIADLIDQKDITNVKGIEELKPEFSYLIRRIIDRIPDSEREVRWVVRYGVVPRRLTREFLEKVMEPHLQRELQPGTGHLDEVKQYSSSFPRGGILEVGTLWPALRSYADATGWLRADADELRFQPEVVEPMRTLLADEPIYRLLHLEALTWFEAQAKNEEKMEEKEEKGRDPRRRAAFLAEAFFHRLQLKEAGVQQWWDDRLREQPLQDWESRRILLEVVTTLLPPGRQIPNDSEGRPLLSADSVGRSHVDLAKLGAGIAWGPCRVIQDPPTIRRLLQAAAQYTGNASWFVRASALVELALAVNDRDYDKALELADEIQRELGPAAMADVDVR